MKRKHSLDCPIDIMIREEPIEKINIHIKDEDLDIEPVLLESFGKLPEVEASRQGSGMLELTYLDANKGVALAEMANRLGLDCSEVMAIGDNDNDISMLNFAEIGVAMGQSDDAVKEQADYVTSSNDEKGVAKAIEKFILKEEQEPSDFSDELIEKVKKANSDYYSNY